MSTGSLIGTRLGPYEITAKLGEGGMGEVYRAHDAKLERDVAIKVLPAAFAEDAERLARFEREARLLAQLHHPSIASVFGLEESGSVRALVMELVEGEDLARRLRRGALPLDDALAVASRIAEALETAHERGIVHRDLKPQNVMLTPAGEVKVLDFGLAKALEPAPASGAPGRSPTNLAASPTETSAGTRIGVILGTAAYMAPEQAKGKTVDRRADIWAFGAVLWECLTGKPLFAADSVAETISNVLTRAPDAQLLPSETPPAVRRLIERCLVRDVRQRLQAIGEARIALEEIAKRTQPEPTMVAASSSGTRAVFWRYAAAALAGVALTIGALALTGSLRGRSSGALGGDRGAGVGTAVTRRTEIIGISVAGSSGIAISPDGREIVGYDTKPGAPSLLRRSMDGFEVRPIPDTSSSFNPFFSRDGRMLGFIRNTQVCVAALDGSNQRCLGEARGFASGTFAPDGSIVYSTLANGADTVPGLWRVPSSGGDPVRVTQVDPAKGEREHGYPHVLPDGAHVIYTVFADAQRSLAIAPLAGGPSRTLLGKAMRGYYVPTGHLLYWDEAQGQLDAIAFDLEHLEVVGRPIELGIDMSLTHDSVPGYDLSDDGTLVYSFGGMFGEDFTVERTDRRGEGTTILAEPGSWSQPRVAPDGKSVLLRRAAQPDCTLWSLDLERGSLSRLGLQGDVHSPLWMSDGERIVASVEPPRGTQGRQMYELLADGDGAPTLIAKPDFAAVARSVSPDGRYVAFARDTQEEHNDIFILDRRSGVVEPFLISDYDEDFPAFSPDGTLVAYSADDSGRREIYVRSFNGVGPGLGAGAKYAISNQGGQGPVWSRDGRELFYAHGDRMMQVRIERSPRFKASVPQALFENPGFVWERTGNYDVLPDGSGFVMVRRGADTPSTRTVRVVFGFLEELARLAARGDR